MSPEAERLLKDLGSADGYKTRHCRKTHETYWKVSMSDTEHKGRAVIELVQARLAAMCYTYDCLAITPKGRERLCDAAKI